MGEGRGSAVQAVALFAILCLLHCEVAESVTYTVGDSSGWTLNMAGWTNGKRFKAGDVLVFNYSPSVHNVVPVNAAGYKACSAPKGSAVFKSGNDRVTLKKGTNYFICTFAGHCQAGMKIAITAA